MPVKVFVEIADPFVEVVQVLGEHSASNHFLLSDTALQFISSPASKPYWALDQFLRVLFEVPQDPDVVVDTKQSPLLVPTINHSRGRQRKPHTGQQRYTQREASARQGHPAPQAPTCHPRETRCHYSSARLLRQGPALARKMGTRCRFQRPSKGHSRGSRETDSKRRHLRPDPASFGSGRRLARTALATSSALQVPA